MRQRIGRRQAAAAGFDFTRHIRAVCADMVARLPELAHIDLTRVAISFSQARHRGRYGLYASLTPLRFAGGARVERRRGQYFACQLLRDQQGREMLYILNFCLPRFLDMGFQDKLSTILHELWHISPRFDGDIRRHEGRCYVHSASRSRYDAAMQQLAARYLALAPDPTVYAFLIGSFEDLQRCHGRVCGLRVARPKLRPISAEEARRLQSAP